VSGDERSDHKCSTHAKSDSKLYAVVVQTVLGKPIITVLDIPECLVTLEEGIENVEQQLVESVALGEKWAILM
jgi:hypothetical protein